MIDNLYQLYESCLGVWILDTYKQLNKNKNIGSLKLLLKLRDINFFKRLNYVVLNCRGDLKDPLVQFLLYLIELVGYNTDTYTPPSTDHKDKDPLNTFRDNLTATDDNTPESALNTHTYSYRNTVSNIFDKSNSNLNRTKVIGGRFNQNKLTVVNPNLNTTKLKNTSIDKKVLIDGYVVFINVFLCSLIPTLLYTYLNRVGNNKYNKLQVLYNYYNYINNNNNDKNSNNNYNTNFNYKNKFTNQVVVSKSFRNENERILLRCKKFSNLMNLIYSDENKLEDELKAYDILFSSIKEGCNYSIYDNLNDLDNVSGLEIVLYKLTLLVNNDFNNNKIYNELPNNIYNIYNKLSSKNILKNQIENNLIYCYRLRINDLNLKLNMNKIFKSLVKYNKNSSNNKYYNPGSINIIEYNEDLYGFNDVDVMNVMSNNLLLFNNNLIYLNKFLGRNSNNMNNNSTDNSNKNNSMFHNIIDVSNVDRWIYYTYNIVNIINGNMNNSKTDNKKNKDKDDKNNNNSSRYYKDYNSSIEYLYYVLLSLMKHIFSLDSDNTVSNKDNNNENSVVEVNMSNKYELLHLKVEGKRRVHLDNNLCLLIIKLNYNFYKILTTNSSNNYINMNNNSNDDNNKISSNKDNNNKRDLTARLTRVLDKIKLRMGYELFPTSYWLVSSHLSLLRFKISSQCQSKPP